jgi:hypothetical protein
MVNARDQFGIDECPPEMGTGKQGDVRQRDSHESCYTSNGQTTNDTMVATLTYIVVESY